MRIGFIGLGIMGRPMAVNLARAGHELCVYARRKGSLEPLRAAGAQAFGSSRDVAAAADVTFTMVSDTPDVEEVVLAPAGIVEGAALGSVVVDMSTISPSATRSIARRFAARGVDMLEPPAAGGEKGAIDGTLSIMVGGEERVFERVLPLFQILGENIVHVGSHGAGQVAKMCNQVLIAQTIAAVGEALILARASGVNPGKVRQALLGGFAYSRVLETHGQRMLDGDYQPGFKTRLHRKDMAIALDAARELGVAVSGAALASQWINSVVGQGYGEEDSAALVRILEGISGVYIPEHTVSSEEE
jgi:2-hydroxy-3-oxopropionate reductase